MQRPPDPDRADLSGLRRLFEDVGIRAKAHPGRLGLKSGLPGKKRDRRRRLSRCVGRFARRFPTEVTCWEYLRAARWPDGFVCPRDDQPATAYDSIRGVWFCRNRHQISVTTDTTLHRTHQPLHGWFLAAHLLAVHPEGVAAWQLMSLIRGKYATAYEMLRRLRSAIADRDEPPLRGVVEVGELIVRGEGRGFRRQKTKPRKSVVMGAVEIRGDTANRVRLQKMAGVTPRQAQIFVQLHIAPGARITTGAGKAYDQLAKLGYRHTVPREPSRLDGARRPKHVNKVLSDVEAWLYETHPSGIG